MIEVTKVECAALEWNKTQESYAKLHEKLASSEPMTWVFVGDSITANDGDVSKGYRSYVEIFDSYLKSTLGRVNDRVVNTAVSGWKVSDIDYDRDIAVYNPDVVYVKVGTNDSFADDSAADRFLQGMTALYEKIAESGAIRIVASANRFSSLWCNVTQTTQFAKYYPDIMRTLVYEQRLLWVDYFGAFSADMPYAESHYFNPDTVHPNRNGMLFHAQTLLKDLGMDKGGRIMDTAAGDLAGVEVSPILLPGVDKNAFIHDGTKCTLADVDLNNSFLMVGGATAVGADPTLITFRSLAQYLNNNNQVGRNITCYCDKDSFALGDYPVSAPLSSLILMPEAYGLFGEVLFAGATAGEIASMIEQALGADMKVVLITPAPNAMHADETKDLADAVMNAAVTKGVPVIDLYGYLQAFAGADPRANEDCYTDGQLNFAGTNDAAILVGTALGKNVIKISDNRFAEDQTTESWGRQNVNGFRYLYCNKHTGEYKELPFVSKEQSDSAVTADRFSLAADLHTFIGMDVLHVGADFYPVKAFTAPYDGAVVVTLKHRRHLPDVSEGGTNGTMWVKCFLNETALTFNNGQDAIVMLAAAGCYNENTVAVDVKKGDVLYAMVAAEVAGQADLIETVTYVSFRS